MISNFFLGLLIGKITQYTLHAQSQSLRFEIFETAVIIGEATGEATSSSEPSDRTASEYNLSEDIFSEIESEISIK